MSVCIGNSCGSFVWFTQNAMKLWEERRSLKDWFFPIVSFHSKVLELGIWVFDSQETLVGQIKCCKVKES